MGKHGAAENGCTAEEGKRECADQFLDAGLAKSFEREGSNVHKHRRAADH